MGLNNIGQLVNSKKACDPLDSCYFPMWGEYKRNTFKSTAKSARK